MFKYFANGKVMCVWGFLCVSEDLWRFVGERFYFVLQIHNLASSTHSRLALFKYSHSITLHPVVVVIACQLPRFLPRAFSCVRVDPVYSIAVLRAALLLPLVLLCFLLSLLLRHSQWIGGDFCLSRFIVCRQSWQREGSCSRRSRSRVAEQRWQNSFPDSWASRRHA